MSFKLSIITVCFNDIDALRATVSSVLPLISADVEYIIKDGGSKDGTAEYVRGLNCSSLRFISASDNGIYDALNTAVSLARGEFVVVINAGDRLLNIPFDILSQLEANVDAAAFAVRLIPTGRIRNPHLCLFSTYVNLLPHQGIFYRTDKKPKYDTAYKVFSDFDLNVQLIKRGKIIVFKNVVAEHSIDGVSNSTESPISEIYQISKKWNGKLAFLLTFLIFKVAGLLQRIGRG